MDYSSIFFVIFFIGTAFNYVLNHTLEFIDYKNRKIHGKEIPEKLAGFIDEKTISKTCDYEDAKYKLWIPQDTFSTIISLVMICSGFYWWVLNYIHTNITQSTFLCLFLFGIFSTLPLRILEIPFELYREFVVEKKFGFSTMTLKTWILDTLKNFFISIIMIVLLLGAMTLIFKFFENTWWLFLGLVYIGFSLLISIIYPLFIAPLFNKFSPLPEGELKNRLEILLQKCGFKSSGLYVMDASKRSKHSNAYFTGFGKSKRVVLYDTLIAQLTPSEIEAVLGHELGHYKKHHIIKRLCVMIPVIILILYAAFVLSRTPSVYQAFGFNFSQGGLAEMTNGVVGESWGNVPQFIGIFLLGVIFGGFSDLAGAVSNYFSRKDEFEADAFAKEICGTGESLSTALIKLNKENLSEISVPKIYSVFNYNHPPILERLKALGYIQ